MALFIIETAALASAYAMPPESNAGADLVTWHIIGNIAMGGRTAS